MKWIPLVCALTACETYKVTLPQGEVAMCEDYYWADQCVKLKKCNANKLTIVVCGSPVRIEKVVEGD